ncbi:glycerol 3-phosphate dehydrogenase-like isoform X4 [Dreissena polymorpha]|uniref:glycerol 3-phosphate dehydrogenase-like isoform X4 n=1 Tax=Dreissena polymorpha TaxID=45954 RepID=UPI002263D7DF|nr:glycerol 3-phosphate dehydrogenase-like isoform X4 [Dreissena polymorpha]
MSTLSVISSARMEETYDVIIIGGGVVGCACVFELTSRGFSCLLLEKNEHLAAEASSGNSGMLHTGFDATEGLELDCIQRCQARVFPLLDKLGVPVNHIGATMVAWDEQQLERFPQIVANSNAAKCTTMHELSCSELYKREPNITCGALGGLWIPGEAVTDPWLFPVLLANDARKKGARILLRSRVCSVVRNTEMWIVETTRGTFNSKCVVNCAGLYGDIVNILAGKSEFRILPRKGQYTVYSKSAQNLLNSSILPVPSDVTKGVIVFRSVYDNVIVGPTAENVDSRRQAPVDESIRLRLTEIAAKVVRELPSHPVVSLYTGVRPATDVKDYIISAETDRKWITVGGIRSTGLSGSLGIAEKVHSLVKTSLNIEPDRGQSLFISKPDVSFTRHGSAIVDGVEHFITHPLTFAGRTEYVANSRM